jgi:hypothetical protein
MGCEANYMKLWSVILKERAYLGDLVIEGKVILNWVIDTGSVKL